MSDLMARLSDHFAGLEAELNRLDAKTGDGDHGTTICKGLKAAAETTEDPGKAFGRAAGGASGSLFAILVGSLHDASMHPGKLAQCLSCACEKIQVIGNAKAGDKTMLDALLPAAEAAEGSDNPAQAAAQASKAGAETTRDMVARRGRAKHVEQGGMGHVDPGAVSVAAMLEVYADSAAG